MAWKKLITEENFGGFADPTGVIGGAAVNGAQDAAPPLATCEAGRSLGRTYDVAKRPMRRPSPEWANRSQFNVPGRRLEPVPTARAH
jgi:hypothetical protein